MYQIKTHQKEAVDKLKNGSVLVAGTGTGKGFTALFYFYTKILNGGVYPLTRPKSFCDLYIITTAMKRDSNDWVRELAQFGLSPDNKEGIRIVVDSWNNIKRYQSVTDSFFIFDEQRTIGFGVWSKTLIKISKTNRWIMLTATPADEWIDLLTVFIANGFYRNKKDFVEQHVVYHPFKNFPSISYYKNVDRLIKLKEEIFVVVDYKHNIRENSEYIQCHYDRDLYIKTQRTQRSQRDNRILRYKGDIIYELRILVNTHQDRISKIIELQRKVKRLITFYTYNEELKALISAFELVDVPIYQRNGRVHDIVPSGVDTWVYLVQYNSGKEAWETDETNHLCFYSITASYRSHVQAKGRITRLSSTRDVVHYYTFASDSPIDQSLLRAQRERRDFNKNDLQI